MPFFQSVASALLLSGAMLAAGEVPPGAPSREALLLEAVITQNVAMAKTLLEQGASTEAMNTENGRTALFFASEMGNLTLVRLLLDHGAIVAAKDKSHGETPVRAAARSRHVDVVRLLLARDASEAESVAWNGVFQQNAPVLEAALETGRLPPQVLSFLLDEAESGGATEVADRLGRSGAVRPTPVAVGDGELARVGGSYRAEEPAPPVVVSIVNGGLVLTRDGVRLALVPLESNFFVRDAQPFPTLRFEIRNDAVTA